MVQRRRRRQSGTGETGQTNQSLHRALGLLERLAESTHGISMSDLSQQIGVPVATTHRLLNTFENLRYARQDADTGLWYVGVQAFIVGSAFLKDRDFVQAAQPVMRTLMEESGETVNLAVLRGNDVVIVNHVECDEKMRMVVPLGSRVPVHASGAGKSLLAALPDYEVTRMLQKTGLAKYTKNTIDTPAGLREELDRTRQRRYAIDNEEHLLGLRCVAATVRDEFGAPLASISISGPTVRVTKQRIAELGSSVLRAAISVTESLGGDSSPHSAAAAAAT